MTKKAGGGGLKRRTVAGIDYLVVDVSHMAHRQYHSLKRLTTRDGRVSGHVFGFLKSLTAIVRDHSPKTVVFCYDRRGSGWRRKILDKYPVSGKELAAGEGYKRNREASDELTVDTEDFNPVPDVERLASHLPGYHLAAEGYEADDMVAAFTASFDRESGRTGDLVVFSGDRDLWQLIDDQSGVRCLFPKREGKTTNLVMMTEADVVAEMGVPPSSVAKMKALLGDASDNIVGVVGASRPGKSVACKLVATSDLPYFDRKVKSRDLEWPEDVPDWLRKPLREQRKRLRANLKVVDLDFAVRRLAKTLDGELPLVAQAKTDDNRLRIQEVLAEFECSSQLNNLDAILDVYGDPEAS